MFKKLFNEDIGEFKYLLLKDGEKKYKQCRNIYACIPLLLIPYFVLSKPIEWLCFIPILMYLGFKTPYFLLSLQHRQRCNDVVSAIPLWMNQICVLIEKNTIHNAIVNSYADFTPQVIKYDLKLFIDQIEKNPEDKQAYINFLGRYKIDEFNEIMLKLFEYRKLSKEKLKYEIQNLNKNLDEIEKMKRKNQFKNDAFIGDTMTCFIIFFPCIYISAVSMMENLFSV